MGKWPQENKQTYNWIPEKENRGSMIECDAVKKSDVRPITSHPSSILAWEGHETENIIQKITTIKQLFPPFF